MKTRALPVGWTNTWGGGGGAGRWRSGTVKGKNGVNLNFDIILYFLALIVDS